MKSNKLKQIEEKIDREYKIIRYALLFLNTNMSENVAKDISKLIGTIDATKLEQEIDEIIQHY
jgi:flagellin-specific chaperone FliS